MFKPVSFKPRSFVRVDIIGTEILSWRGIFFIRRRRIVFGDSILIAIVKSLIFSLSNWRTAVPRKRISRGLRISDCPYSQDRRGTAGSDGGQGKRGSDGAVCSLMKRRDKKRPPR